MVDTAFVLSLAGGSLITVASILGLSYAAMGRTYFWGMGGMMGAFYPSMMGGWFFGNGSFYGMMTGLALVGLVAGILVLFAALSLRSKPSTRKTYGTLIVVFSLLSLVGWGGFFIGAILGLIGGILALAS